MPRTRHPNLLTPATEYQTTMGDWVLPSLSQVLDRPMLATGSHLGLTTAQRTARSQREWRGAVLALELLLQTLPKPEDGDRGGLLLSGPVPIIGHPEILQHFDNWTFTAHPLAAAFGIARRLAPAAVAAFTKPDDDAPHHTITLLPQDCLAAEQFCMVRTATFSLVLLLSQNSQGQPQFWFSFDPDINDRVWQILRLRVVMLNEQHVSALDSAIAQFPPVAPPYEAIGQFTQTLMACLPEPQEALTRPLDENFLAAAVQRVTQRPTVESGKPLGANLLDVDLLQAFAHEVRTPLTTIQTLTKSLLKRLELTPDVVKRLEMIERECSEQINRFGLIFRAVELETTQQSGLSLTAIDLDQLFERSIPHWQKQASQRGLTLEVLLPQHLPSVMTDPTMLNQTLTSLIERSARSLPSGSTIQVEATIAGHQLKLQVETRAAKDAGDSKPHSPLLKSLGQILMFQPETGSISLNLAVTKNLFQAMGGKMIVRQRAEEGEVLTIFLPIERSRSPHKA
jgi:signal transduction histidine kinase